MPEKRRDEVVRHHVDVHIHGTLGGGTGDISELKTLIQQLSTQLTAKVDTMSAEIDALTAEVSRNTTVDESAITLLQGLAARIEALKTDPAALQALANELRSKNDALAAAVVANTPAETP